jgi:FAD-dependent urate hydroxylase
MSQSSGRVRTGLRRLPHAADGLEIRVLGEPMSFWEQQMPQGMRLCSPYVASNSDDPGGELTLDDFERALLRPVGLEQFVGYGRWFQQQSFPQLDTRKVARVEANGGFRLELADGEQLRSRRLVVAAGIMPFAWMAAPVPAAAGQTGLPLLRASRSRPLRRSARHRRRRRPERARVGCVSARSRSRGRTARARATDLLPASRAGLHHLGPLTRLLFAPAEVGPAGVSRLVSAPS